MYLAIPAIFCNVFARLQTTANVVFIGQTGSEEMMAGVGLGDVALTFLGQYALLGLNNAIETLVAQAAGAKNLHLAGVYLNRGRVLLTFFLIPLSVLYFYIERILLYLGQEAEASKYAQQYALYFLPGLYMMLLGDI